MNEFKYLVLLDNEDKTREIVRFENNVFLKDVYFKGSPKPYKYSWDSFAFYKDPIEVSAEQVSCGKLKAFEKAVKILKFERYIKVFYKNGTTLLLNSQTINNMLTRQQDNLYEYFKEISKIVSITTGEGVALLENEFDKINFNDSKSAFYKYLNPWMDIQKYEERRAIIYPFGTNKSQMKATKEALTNQISVIQGPPGTGKTQTILNIIANLIIRGKTVAVVSNNNAATKNVLEKMQKYDMDFLCAQLGKRDNKREFLESQTGEYPTLTKENHNRDLLSIKLHALNKEVDEITMLQNEKAKLREIMNAFLSEKKYFDKYDGGNANYIRIRKTKTENSKSINALKLKIECEEKLKNGERINIFFKIRSIYKYGIGSWSSFEGNISSIIKKYKWAYYTLKIREISDSIYKCQKRLEELEEKEKLGQLIEESMNMFSQYVKDRYTDRAHRHIFNEKELLLEPEKFNREYPVVLSTTYSIKNALKKDYKFDYIIIDEASQVDLITGALALSSAQNVIVVGDLKQLPNVVTQNNRRKIDELTANYKIRLGYNFTQKCLLESITDVLTNVPKTLLREHYRCHPKIIGFCNKKFYDDELIIMTDDRGEDDVMKAIITPMGNHARGHLNQRQIDIIKEEVLPELKEKTKEIGVISPYRQQKSKLISVLEEDIKVDTVHKFQGREEEGIILTTVDNEIGEFVDNANMLNVAVSRAKKYLRVIVSDDVNNEGTNIYDLVKYIQYNNFEIKNSKTKSIYDLLYKENREERIKYLQSHGKISEYASENLTYQLIKDVILDGQFNNLDVVTHVPLRELILDVEMLTEEEKRYALRSWTHIDFVIYNKMDKKIVLAIEVDGYAFHKEGTKQRGRDLLKDNILKKYNVPLLRLNTTGSGEKERIDSELRSILVYTKNTIEQDKEDDG